jgi:uncharacterized RDD family membrane protein YckC
VALSCPKCGFETVGGANCPRCGVDVARYRAEMACVGAVAGGAGPATGLAYAHPATTSTPPLPSHRPAGFWIRVVAVVIDAAVLLATQAVFGSLVWLFFRSMSPRLTSAVVNAFRLVSDSAYFVVLYWLCGQTLGKMAMRIRVVPVAGGSLSLGESVLRWLGYLVSSITLGVGYVMAGLRADKRALHDLIAGTRVEHV